MNDISQYMKCIPSLNFTSLDISSMNIVYQDLAKNEKQLLIT
jgi:hypothetical protein